jgi:hypothetical protein
MRSFFPILTAIVVSLFLIAVGSFYWILQQSSLNLLSGGVTVNPNAAMFISKQAPVMVSLLVNPDRLDSFAQFVSSGKDRRRSHREISQIRDNLIAKTKINYKNELQAWLGDEVTWAVTSLDYDHNLDNGITPGYLLVVENKNSLLAKEFLEIYYSKQAISELAELVFTQYQGVKIISQRPLIDNLKVSRVSSAVVGNFVLFANDSQVIKEAINNAQAVQLNLAHYQPYQQAISTITEPKISVTYVNLPNTSAWLGNSSSPQRPFIQQTLTLSLSLTRQGLVAHSALFGVEAQANQIPSFTNPPLSLNYIPQESILVASGRNLQQFWQQVSTGLPQNSPLEQIVNQTLTSIEKSLQISLAKDIFSWVDGEYSLALFSDQESKKPHWIFVTDKQDLTPIQHLDELAKNQGLSVGNLPLAEQTITTWTNLVTTSKNKFASLNAEVKGVHATMNNYQILTNSVDVLHDLMANRHDSLLNAPSFQDALSSLPSENNGYLYIDWEKFEPILAQKFPVIRVAELVFQPLFDNLRSLIITSEGIINQVQRTTILCRF